MIPAVTGQERKTGAAQTTTQQFNHYTERITFVAAKGENGAIIKLVMGIASRVALLVDDPAFRHQFALIGGHLQLPMRHRRGGKVKEERRLIGHRQRPGNRVGAQRPSRAAIGGDNAAR